MKERKNTNTKVSETRGIKLALLAYVILVALQLTAYLFTNAMVLYAQTLEMLSDVMVSVFLLLSFYWSRKPADKFHMFGHGRAQNVAAIVSATILIFFMSLEAFREAIPKLFQASEATGFQNASLALIVIIVGMFVIIVPSIDILRVKAKGASLKAQMVALLKDEISYVAALCSSSIDCTRIFGGRYHCIPVRSLRHRSWLDILAQGQCSLSCGQSTKPAIL